MFIQNDVAQKVFLREIECVYEGVYALLTSVSDVPVYNVDRIKGMAASIVTLFPKELRTGVTENTLCSFLQGALLGRAGFDRKYANLLARKIAGNQAQLSVGAHVTTSTVAACNNLTLFKVEQVMVLGKDELKLAFRGITGWAAGGVWYVQRARSRANSIFRLAGLLGKYDKTQLQPTALSDCYLFLSCIRDEENENEIKIMSMGSSAQLRRRNKKLWDLRHEPCEKGMTATCYFCTLDKLNCARSVTRVNPEIGVCESCDEQAPLHAVGQLLMCLPCVGVALRCIKQNR